MRQMTCRRSRGDRKSPPSSAIKLSFVRSLAMSNDRSCGKPIKGQRHLALDSLNCRAPVETTTVSPRDWQGHPDPPGDCPLDGSPRTGVGSPGQQGALGTCRTAPSSFEAESADKNCCAEQGQSNSPPGPKTIKKISNPARAIRLTIPASIKIPAVRGLL